MAPPAHDVPSHQSDWQPPYRKKWFIAIMLILAAFALAAIIILLRLQDSLKGDQNTNTDSIRIERPGYPNQPGSVADPLSLILRARGKPVIYNGAPVIQACAILTPQDLRAAGTPVSINPLPGGMLSRVFFDGKGKAVLPPSEALQHSNKCEYSSSQRIRLSLVVYQQNYEPVGTVREELRLNYQQMQTLDQITVFKRTKSENGEQRYILEAPDVFARLEIFSSTSLGKSKTEALLKKVAHNLARQSEHPTAANFVYDSPTFTGSYANSCEISNNDDFKAVFGVDSSPLVTERVATTVGIINYGSLSDDSADYNYIRSQCIRVPGRGLTNLTIYTESYESKHAATVAFEADVRSEKEAEKVAGIGNEAIFSHSNNSPIRGLSFREGRIIIRLALYDPATASPGNPSQTTLPTKALIDKLTPAAKAIAERLSHDAAFR